MLRAGFEPASPARKNKNDAEHYSASVLQPPQFLTYPVYNKFTDATATVAVADVAVAVSVDVLHRFREWLTSRGFSYKYVSDCVGAVRRFGDIVLGKRSLVELERVRGKRHVLMGLSNWARFLGLYRQWKRMLEDYDVHWSDGSNSAKWFFSLLEGKETVEEAEKYLQKIEEKADDETKRICRFLYFSGLRPIEAINCFNLVKDGALRNGYLNNELLLLQHWKYEKLFLRGGKKAFCTVLTEKMLDELKTWEGASCSWYYEKLKRRLKSAGLEVNLYVFRKSWATKMRMNGLEAEFVDLFQGRVQPTIFVRCYFRPDFKEAVMKVRRILEVEEEKMM